MASITPQHQRYGYGVTRRIVMANIVCETSLPYNAQLLDHPEDAYDFWKSVVETSPTHEKEKECLVVALLNARLAPFSWHVASLGGVTETAFNVREVLRPALATNAYGLVLMHNHPAGDPSPSVADERATRKLVEACELVGIRLFDHVIIGHPAVGRRPYYSFREAGMIR